MPINVRGSFQGTALAAQQSQGQQWFLIVAALVVIYIVLGHALREPDPSDHRADHAALGRASARCWRC